MMTDTADLLRRHQYAIERWVEYSGQYRAAILRLGAIAVFYAVYLLNHHGDRLGPLGLSTGPPLEARQHQAITALAVAWTMLGTGVVLCLRSRFLPWWLKYLATTLDFVLLTSVLMLSYGPRSPMAVAYLALLAMSALPGSLPLLRWATIFSVVSYMFLCGYASWFAPEGLSVPRYSQIVMSLTLAVSGLSIGQVLRVLYGSLEKLSAQVISLRETPLTP